MTRTMTMVNGRRCIWQHDDWNRRQVVGISSIRFDSMGRSSRRRCGEHSPKPRKTPPSAGNLAAPLAQTSHCAAGPQPQFPIHVSTTQRPDRSRPSPSPTAHAHMHSARPRRHGAAVDERQAGQLVGRPAARVVQRRRPQGAAAAGGRVGARTRAGGGEVNRESAKARAREGKESTGVSDDVAATTTT